MRVLITGGTGFIGRALCERLLARGHQVTVVTRDPVAALARVPQGVSLLAGLSGLGEACTTEPFEAVVHLAGASIADGRWTAARKRLLRSSRIEATAELIRALQLAPQAPRVLVSASGADVFGDAGDRELDELAPPGTGFLADLCREWEQAALTACSLGVRVCILRFGSVLDRDGGMLPRLLPLFRWGLGARLGGGRQWMPWIHRADAVGLIEHLLATAAAEGPFHATAPQPVTNAQFTRELAAVLHRPALLSVPGFALHLLYGEIADALLSSKRMIPRRTQESGFRFTHPELGAALRAILT